MTIDRAAKAIWLSRAGAMDKTDARILARSALDSVYPPTSQMISAGAKAYKNMTGPASDEEVAEWLWSVMHVEMMKDQT